ncbi:MAG: DNA alkylation repair protein [Candidatus Hodarchaeota archaeon]
MKSDAVRSRIDKALKEHTDLLFHSLDNGNTMTVDQHQWQWLGVRTPQTRQIANTVFKELRSHGIKDIDSILEYCEHLLSYRISEYRTIAFQWTFKCKKQFQPEHFEIFERWLKTYVTGWGSCDDFCVHTLGYFLLQYPMFISRVKSWTLSSNNMTRRASAVSLIYALRRGEYLPPAFEIADNLLNDSDIYVLKGYGWMLKEATKHFPDKVFQYVLDRKNVMPRVSLRYAIEKMPEERRKKAMAK